MSTRWGSIARSSGRPQSPECHCYAAVSRACAGGRRRRREKKRERKTRERKAGLMERLLQKERREREAQLRKK